MLDLQVNQQPGSISTNFQEIEAALKEHLEGYRGITVTQDTIKESKKDLSELRKLKESIEDARKNVKKEWMEPYTEFEGKCKELVALVDQPINEINDQLKLFEEDRVREKTEHCKEVYSKNIGELERFLPFEAVFNPKWTNVSTKDSDIVFEIQEKTLRIKTDLAAIQALNSEIYDDVIEAYINSGNNLASAIQRNNQYIADKNKVEAQVKAESESKEAPKVNPEAMGELDKVVQAFKTVTFIVSAEDAQRVENMLSFEDISFRRVEG